MAIHPARYACARQAHHSKLATPATLWHVPVLGIICLWESRRALSWSLLFGVYLQEAQSSWPQRKPWGVPNGCQASHVATVARARFLQEWSKAAMSQTASRASPAGGAWQTAIVPVAVHTATTSQLDFYVTGPDPSQVRAHAPAFSISFDKGVPPPDLAISCMGCQAQE